MPSITNLILNFISKIVYFLFRKLLEVKKIDFREKNIIIIGPAETVQDEINEIDLSKYDFIVRMNRSIDIPLTVNGRNIYDIDILFHNLKNINKNGRGGGAITKEKIQRSKIQQVILPSAGAKSCMRVLLSKLKLGLLGATPKLSMLPLSTFIEMKKLLNGFSPTTGFAALYFLINCDPKSLHIIGFTFFQTKYQPGYNDLVNDRESAHKRAEFNAIHDPVLEAKNFKELYELKLLENKKITLGQDVQNSIYNM